MLGFRAEQVDKFVDNVFGTIFAVLVFVDDDDEEEYNEECQINGWMNVWMNELIYGWYWITNVYLFHRLVGIPFLRHGEGNANMVRHILMLFAWWT